MKKIFKDYLKATGKAAAAKADADIAAVDMETDHLKTHDDYCEALDIVIEAFTSVLRRRQGQ